MAEGEASKDRPPEGGSRPKRLPRKLYERELLRLQAETVELQEWVRQERARLVVVFEGRDAAGKGSAIKRLTQYLNPRVARIVALPAPTDRQKGRWINMLAHLLSTLPYYDVERIPLELPSRSKPGVYERPERSSQRYVPDHAAKLLRSE